MEFANPGFLYLLIIIPLLVAWYWFRNRKYHADIRVPSMESLQKSGRSPKEYLYHGLVGLRLLAAGLLIVALARPQTSTRKQDITIEGIDIVLTMDISGSMLAEDFQPNRLEASKKVASEFVGGRPNDRMGLVVFSGETFTQCPLTTDHTVLLNLFKDIKSGMIEDGTAIGDGLATAVNRLKESQAISKVIILLTDGENNMGSLDPLSAGEIAKIFGIRVYTIGVGTIGTAPYPVQTPFGTRYQNMEVRIDEPLLREIAAMTGARYFRATDNQKLTEIYQEIDRLEKSKIDVTEFRKKNEEFLPFALLAGLVLLLEMVLRYTVLRNIP
ncbi:MAG: VWA domain-containing protein [Lentimicrobiaceae bacterium]|nr:VWA domain-containing protein [Lentimicrobiaceae bacterium]